MPNMTQLAVFCESGPAFVEFPTKDFPEALCYNETVKRTKTDGKGDAGREEVSIGGGQGFWGDSRMQHPHGSSCRFELYGL